VQDGDHMAYLDHIRSDHSMLQLFTKPGARVPLYCTGVGKMLLSRWPSSQVEAYLDRTPLTPHTPHTLVDRGKLLHELARIRTQGYSVDNQEMEEGVRCVAALVADHHGEPAGVVSISGAAMRVAPQKIKFFAKSVKNCSQAISKDLGFNPPHPAPGRLRRRQRRVNLSPTVGERVRGRGRPEAQKEKPRSQ